MTHEVDESGVLVVSLREDALNEEFELSLKAHRSIDSSQESLVLSMPKPHASSISSTELIVLPADNIDLREDPKKAGRMGVSEGSASGIVGLAGHPTGAALLPRRDRRNR